MHSLNHKFQTKLIKAIQQRDRDNNGAQAIIRNILLDKEINARVSSQTSSILNQ